MLHIFYTKCTDCKEFVLFSLHNGLIFSDSARFGKSNGLYELSALLQRRLGMEAVSDLEAIFVPIVTTVWVDAELHRLGITLLLAANRRQLSLVDCVSFAVCQQGNVRSVFAFDAHFVAQGFEVLTSHD